MMDFLKNYGGMIIGGLLAVGAFMLSGGGIIGILLASLIGAGAFMFGGNLMEQLTQTAQPVMEKFGLAEPERKKHLPIKVEKELGSGDEKNHAIVNIDGRDYDIMVTYEDKVTPGKPTKMLVNGIKFKPVDAADSQYQSLDLQGRKIDVGTVVGGEQGLQIDQEKANNIYLAVAKNVRAIGKQASKEEDVHLYSLKENNRFIAYAKTDKKSYIVELTDDGFNLLDLQGKAVLDKDKKPISISGIDKEALKDGMLAREVAKAVQLVDGQFGTKIEEKGQQASEKANNIVLDNTINSNKRHEQLTEGNFKIDGKEASFKIEGVKLIVTRNGRGLDPVALRENIIEKATADITGNRLSYSTDVDKLKGELKSIIDEDDKKVKDYYKITTKISNSEYLLHSKDGAFLIKIEKNGAATITNLDGTDKGNFSVESGGLSEAFHRLQKAEISPQAPDRAEDHRTLAINAVSGQRFPVIDDKNTAEDKKSTYVASPLPESVDSGVQVG